MHRTVCVFIRSWAHSGGSPAPARSTRVRREVRLSTTPRSVVVLTCDVDTTCCCRPGDHAWPGNRAETPSLLQTSTSTTAVKIECERLD